MKSNKFNEMYTLKIKLNGYGMYVQILVQKVPFNVF